MITNRSLLPLGIYTPDLVIVFDQIADLTLIGMSYESKKNAHL